MPDPKEQDDVTENTEPTLEEQLATAWDESSDDADKADKADEEAAGEAFAGEESAGEEAAGEAGEESAGEEAAGEEPADEEAAGEAGEESAGEESAGDSGEESEDDTESLRDQLARLEQMLADREQPAEEPEPEQAPEPQSLYTEEEQAALNEFQTEWPEVAQGIELMFRQQRQKLLQEVQQQVEPVITPAVQYAQQQQASQHQQRLVEAHPDYDTIYDDIIEWVDGQPEYLKQAYTHVAQNGSTDEVIDLISRFKAEKGIAPQSQKPPAERKPAPEQRKKTLPDEAKKAAASLGVVDSQRSATQKAEDPNDFDSAWADAASS